jgi:Xaa-Pro aminopeptidase
VFERVAKKVEMFPIDGYLILHSENMKWLCNRSSYYAPGVMLATRDEVLLFTKARSISAIRQAYAGLHVVAGGIEELAGYCAQKKLCRIGFESNRMPVDELERLGSHLHCELVPMADFVEDLRMVKTPEEISAIQAATRIADAAYVEFLNHLRAGLTEIEAKNIFRNILFGSGAEELSFDILLSSGHRTFFPHSISTDKEISNGDLVLMDFGVVVGGYCSDTTRTVAIGYATEKQREVYDIVLQAQGIALQSIKAGVTCRQADAFARDVIMKEHPHGCYDYGLGHGIGVGVHEKPRMGPQSEQPLLANTVVSVEPGIYIEGWGGVRIEDVLLIGDTNPGVNLTRAPKEFLIIS